MTERGYDVFLYLFAVLMMALLFGSGMYVGYILNEKRHYENRMSYVTYRDAEGNIYFDAHTQLQGMASRRAAKDNKQQDKLKR